VSSTRDKPISTTANVIDDTMYSSASAPSDNRGGETQIFGGKASEPQTSRPVEKRNFTYHHLHLAPRWG